MAIYVRNKEGVMESYKIVGLKGENGVTPDIQIGTVTTLEPGEKATVTRRGTKEEPIFDFGIPKGADGVGGTSGDSNDGASIDDTTISTKKTWSSSKIENFVLTNNNTIWKEVNGENLKIEHSKEGYLREVEIWGNTIQNSEDLSDIQHLGELYVDDDGKPKLDSQGRKQYKIDIISHKGLAYKNIQYNGGRHLGNNRYSLKPNGAYAMCNFQLNPNDVNIGDKFKIILEIESKTEDIDWDKVTLYYFASSAFGNQTNFEKRIGRQVVEGTIQKLPQNLNRFVLIQTHPSVKTGEIVFRINIIFEKESFKTTILTPCQLMKVGNIADRLYWDSSKGRYVVEKRIKKYLVSGNEFTVDLNTNQSWKKENTFRYRTDTPLFSDYNPTSDSQETINNMSTLSKAVSYSDIFYKDIEGIASTNKYNKQIFVLSIAKSKITSTIQDYFSNNKTDIYYPSTPELIETNITEELKLPTYINNTYISVIGGIQGTIKAKAPVDGGKVIATLQRENIELKATNEVQDELINTTMLATDEMYMMLEPLLAEAINLNERSVSKMVDMYVAMVQRGIKTIESVPVSIRDCVAEMLSNKE